MSPSDERFRRLSDRFEELVAGVPSERWTNQSPCADWDALAVVSHVIDIHAMTLATAGRSLSPAATVSDDPLDALRHAREDVQALLDDPAANIEVDGAFGRTTPAETIDGFLGFDLVVHAWDLARATGQDDTMEPDEVERIASEIAGFGDALRSQGVCGPEVAVHEGASAQDKLVGKLGRNPDYTP